MKKIISIVAAVSVIASCGHRSTQPPKPGDPFYAECYDCQELLRDPYLKVIPSQDGLVSVWHTVLKDWRLRDIKPTWDKLPSDTSDMILFESKDGKFGFFDGDLLAIPVIPANHRRAWVFSEGLCAVEDDGCVRFLDKFGKPAFEGRTFPYYGHPLDDFVFRGGVCAVPDTTLLCGVIDINGDWVVEPLFKDITVTEDCIIASSPGIRMQFALDGTLVNPALIDEIHSLDLTNYSTGLYAYIVSERWGMMDSKGERLTEPIYVDISPINPNLFRATLSDEVSIVLLDNKGRIIK